MNGTLLLPTDSDLTAQKLLNSMILSGKAYYTFLSLCMYFVKISLNVFLCGSNIKSICFQIFHKSKASPK